MMDEPNSGSTARFFGGLLMAVGGLIAVTSGLCSVAITAYTLTNRNGAPGMWHALLTEDLPLLCGIPFAVGAVLFLLGRAVRRGWRTAD